MSGGRRTAAFLGRRLLDVLAAAGVICIALAVAAVLLNVSIVMFATGSMAPAIPAGSAAIVREVPATELRVGDVVTVDRPDALPITHRVTEVVGVEGEVVTFTMQGDANAAPDPAPYVVAQARVVLLAIPGIAPALAAAQQPGVLAAVTLAGAVLVTWAFWPRRDGEDEDDGQDADPAGDDADADDPSTARSYAR